MLRPCVSKGVLYTWESVRTKPYNNTHTKFKQLKLVRNLLLFVKGSYKIDFTLTQSNPKFYKPQLYRGDGGRRRSPKYGTIVSLFFLPPPSAPSVYLPPFTTPQPLIAVIPTPHPQSCLPLLRSSPIAHCQSARSRPVAPTLPPTSHPTPPTNHHYQHTNQPTPIPITDMGLQRSLVLIAATAVSLLAQSSTECDCLDGGCAPVPSCVSTTQCILDCASDALTSTTCATSDLASFLSCRLLEDDAKIVACVSAAVDNANAECGVCITGVIQDIEDIQDETLNNGFLAGQLPCIKPTNFEGW